MTNNTPTPVDNPHKFEQHVLDRIADASGRMYDHFFDLLSDYQFDFTLEEKNWMLDRIVADIKAANEAAEEEEG